MRFFALAGILSTVALGFADDAKPLFEANFDDGIVPAPLFERFPKMEVADGALVVTHETNHAASPTLPIAFKDAELSFRFRIPEKVGFFTCRFEEASRVKKAHAHLGRLEILPGLASLKLDQPPKDREYRKPAVLATHQANFADNQWHKVTIRFQGSVLTATIDDEIMLEGTHPHLGSEKIGTFFVIRGGSVQLDDLKLTSLPSGKTTGKPADLEQSLAIFHDYVDPLLTRHCYECHSHEAKKAKGGLVVDSLNPMLKGGDLGAALVPGDPEASLLYEVITYHNDDLQMPPDGKLGELEIEKVRQWIALGAAHPRTGPALVRTIDFEAARKQWAFQAPQAPVVPSTADRWSNTDIDRFIFAKIQAQSLAVADDADPYTKLRRLTFDLTGLPPTPEDVRRFNADPSPAAWEREVDRLLSTKAYAERWGRHWLDVARFAESSGGGRSLMFPHAWRYRDYVIQSFDRDKPYDVFLTEQLAGDLLPYDTQAQRDEQLVATSYLVLGAINYELQDKQLLEMEVIDEQLEAIGRGFMGMTMACARCHDHKFDPISARDYYAMAGIFSSTESLTPGNVSGYVTRTLGPPELANARDVHKQEEAASRKRVKKLEDELAALRNGLGPGLVVDNKQARLKGDWKSSTALKHVGGDYVHDQFSGKGEKTASFMIELPEPGDYEVRMSYNNAASRAPSVPVEVHHADGVARLKLNQQKPPSDGMFELLGVFSFQKMGEVVVSNEGTDGFVVIVDAVQWRPLGKPDQQQQDALDAAVAAVETAKQKLRDLQKLAPPEPEITMSVKDSTSPKDGHIHLRGQVRVLGDKVPRGFLSVVDIHADTHEDVRIPNDASGRLQLARWLTSPNHPLTARVMANRVWHYLMGEGLVRTVDNFGTMGEAPSHPELLDHLAVQFRDQGWSVKKLIRQIVLSRTYQLSSRETADQRRIDPENRWLARARRRRLDSDAIRDSMLSISGQLEEVEGGRTIRRLSAYDLGYDFGDIRQRSVYVPAFRNARVELLDVFDAPNPNLVSGRRATSTLPTQALFLLNSPFVLKQAEATAQQILKIPPDRRIEAAFMRMLSRPPRESEVAWAQQIVASGNAANAAKGGEGDDAVKNWTRLCQLLFASVDFRYLY